MNKKQITILVVVVFFIVTFLVYYYMKNKQAILDRLNRQKAEDEANANKQLPATSAASSLCSKGNSFPLQYGSCGTNVTRLQKALTGLTADGKFGNNTQSKLKAVTGKTTISEAELIALEGGKSVTITNGNIVTFTGAIAYVDAIRSDDKAIRWTWRNDEDEIYKQLNALSDDKLKEVALLYKETHREKLYDVIDDMTFSPDAKVDVQIKSKLERLGLK